MNTTTETTKSQKPTKTPKRTASYVFQQAILNNVDKTDLEIFREVQAEFGADKIPDRHANYVGWYRGFLKKKGMNPPPAVKAAKTLKADAAPTVKAEEPAKPAVKKVADKKTSKRK